MNYYAEFSTIITIMQGLFSVFSGRFIQRKVNYAVYPNISEDTYLYRNAGVVAVGRGCNYCISILYWLCTMHVLMAVSALCALVNQLINYEIGIVPGITNDQIMHDFFSDLPVIIITIKPGIEGQELLPVFGMLAIIPTLWCSCHVFSRLHRINLSRNPANNDKLLLVIYFIFSVCYTIYLVFIVSGTFVWFMQAVVSFNFVLLNLCLFLLYLVVTCIVYNYYYCLFAEDCLIFVTDSACSAMDKRGMEFKMQLHLKNGKTLDWATEKFYPIIDWDSSIRVYSRNSEDIFSQNSISSLRVESNVCPGKFFSSKLKLMDSVVVKEYVVKDL